MMMFLPRTTETYPGAPLAASAPALPPVLYNHGLISFASENSSLMQELASRGHVVIAIEHVDQLLEWQTLNHRQPPAEKRLAQQLTSQVRRAAGAERARLARALSAASSSTRRIVVERAEDTRLVLDTLASTLGTIPGHVRGPTAAGAHRVGYSIGGAVATEAAPKTGAR
jgi:dienelactone hydrolase